MPLIAVMSCGVVHIQFEASNDGNNNNIKWPRIYVEHEICFIKTTSLSVNMYLCNYDL